MRSLPSVFPFALVILGLAGCSVKAPEPVASSYQMGERIALGNLAYTVVERQWLPQVGAGVDARVPQNRFFLVRVSAVNKSGNATIIPAVSLVDDAGETFPEVQNGDGIPDFIGSLREVAPAATTQGNLVFDVAPKHYKLKLSDEDGKSVALVDIPLSFEADTPEVPLSIDLNHNDASKNAPAKK
jgi:hypothetical protein